MHDFVALDPLSISVGVTKLTEADGLETCQGLRSNRVAARAHTGWERQRSVVRVQEVFPAPLPVANTGVGSAHGVAKTLGGRAVEGKMLLAVGTHLRVLGLQGTEPALCSLAWLSGDRWAHVGSVAKAAPCALRPLIT